MANNVKGLITVPLREASLKRKLRRHLNSLGFRKDGQGNLVPPGTEKEAVRTIHSLQRRDRMEASRAFIKDKYPKLIEYFASGTDIQPTRIKPVLQRVSSDSWEGDLFRLASLTWSVPVSNGFGRRMRYLVWDESNGKLMGIIAIGDPVFNLSVRDNLIDWTVADRGERLVNMMDAYVLGALPPYNSLLAGKLVTCLIRTRDVYDDFARTYGKTTGIISNQEKKARLLAVTTSSSMGRSSVYNRLKLSDTQYFRSIGYTGGWGHFHIPDSLFEELRDYLRAIGHSYADQHMFGEGPNWRLRSTRAALVQLGFDEDLLRHGIQREVFLCELADNACRMLHAGRGRPNLTSLRTAEEVGALALDRWVIPRSQRQPDYLMWTRDSIGSLLSSGAEPVLTPLERAAWAGDPRQH